GGPESDLLIASLGNKKLAKKLATPGGRARALVSLTAKSIFMHYFVWPGYAIFKAPGTLVSYKQDTWRPEKPELRLVKK
ncbi:MAG: hypothetical protein EBV30_11585, partial [Actinobacteria bacterium]|nr:hypothetical protein [Actinomycetota bacterium]